MAADPGMRGILFDIDGVFFVGDQAVPGAADVVAWAGDAGIPYLFVTNTTSHPRSHLVTKLAGFGVTVDVEQILTPAVAARAFLGESGTGSVALFVPSETAGEMSGLDLVADQAEDGAGAVVIGDLGAAWDFATMNRAFRLLMAQPPPVLVSLGLTRYWRDSDGLHLDVGAFTEALHFASGVEPVVVGKPAAEFFQIAVRRLGLPPEQVLMVGDDVRGDVDGAQRAGLGGVLVRTGKFTPADLGGGIEPTAVLDTVADLPAWWDGSA